MVVIGKPDKNTPISCSIQPLSRNRLNMGRQGLSSKQTEPMPTLIKGQGLLGLVAYIENRLGRG